MNQFASAGLLALALLAPSTIGAMAQPAARTCTSSPSAGGTQTWLCTGGITIVAESGARFELRDANRDGHIDSIELSSKALLIEVPKQPGGRPFKVLTPQAIAAVRGTRWAVDAGTAKTAVFVAEGRVAVGRRSGGRSVVLGAGDGVDVAAGSPLTVKPWGQQRIDALMARLGR